VGFEPVLVGPLAMGKHLIPGTPLAGERSAEEIRKIIPTLS
jgi:predicted dinucleotide-binding enzyme